MFHLFLVEPRGPPSPQGVTQLLMGVGTRRYLKSSYFPLDTRVPGTVKQRNAFPGVHPKMILRLPTSLHPYPGVERTPPNSLSQTLLIASNLSVLLLAINKLKCYQEGVHLIYKTRFSLH